MQAVRRRSPDLLAALPHLIDASAEIGQVVCVASDHDQVSQLSFFHGAELFGHTEEPGRLQGDARRTAEGVMPAPAMSASSRKLSP